VKETWLRAMEQANRCLGGELPIDLFLPELHAITDPEPAPPVEAVEPLPAPPVKRRSARPGPGVPTTVRPGVPPAPKQPPAPAEQSPEDAEAEIREFMNRNQRGPSEDDDFSQFLGSGMDPNFDPE
jgi:hypothetical protein